MNLEVGRHLSLQAGVISRRQALEAGMAPHDVKRLVRRREWTPAHPGVFVSHTGPLTWVQRAWAAVLHSWPAALCLESALRAGDGPGMRDRISDELIHVGVDRRRTSLVAPPGVSVHHLTRLDERVLWNLGPPRLRYDDAALDVAAGARSELDAIAALAKACQSRRTTATRLITALGERERVARRRWLAATLRDVADGTCSVLEHAYLLRVERAHRLPVARRQVRATASVRVIYRDAEYDEGCFVELDGRLFHDSITQRDADFERDLDAAVAGRSTVRLSWGQVFDRPCSTTAKLVLVLRAHGVLVTPCACAPGCPVAGLGLVA
jgi:hypothetical protein